MIPLTSVRILHFVHHTLSCTSLIVPHYFWNPTQTTNAQEVSLHMLSKMWQQKNARKHYPYAQSLTVLEAKNSNDMGTGHLTS